MIDYFVEHADSGDDIVGFKWKPYAENDAYQCALDVLRPLNISVIHNTRNPLDQLISNAKHKNYNLNPHCGIGNDKCLDEALGATVYLSGDHLIHKIDNLWEEKQHWHEVLQTYSPRLLEVMYDDLYTDHTIVPNESTWIELMNFLGYSTEFTLQGLEKYKSPTQVTHTGHQSDTVINMDEVEEWLTSNGTEYASLIH